MVFLAKKYLWINCVFLSLGFVLGSIHQLGATNPVTWSFIDGYTEMQNSSLYKYAATGDGNSGAISTNVLPAGGSGLVQLTIANINTIYSFGVYREIGGASDFNSYRTANHAFYFTDQGMVYLMEVGQIIGSISGIRSGDTFTISIDRGVVTYLYNGIRVKQSVTSTRKGQLIFAEIYEGKSEIPTVFTDWGDQYIIEISPGNLGSTIEYDVYFDNSFKFSVLDSSLQKVGVLQGNKEIRLDFTKPAVTQIYLFIDSRKTISNVKIKIDGSKQLLNPAYYSYYNTYRGIIFKKEVNYPDFNDPIESFDLGLLNGIALTPNDDSNNLLQLNGVSGNTQVTIDIYSIAGLSVYRSNDFVNEPWDGKVNYVVKPGNYTYSMLLNGNNYNGQFIIYK